MPAPALQNDRFINFPEANNKGGIVTVDRHKITGASDLFDGKGDRIIGGCYILLDNGNAVPVLVARNTVITTLLMADGKLIDGEPLAS